MAVFAVGSAGSEIVAAIAIAWSPPPSALHDDGVYATVFVEVIQLGANSPVWKVSSASVQL